MFIFLDITLFPTALPKIQLTRNIFAKNTIPAKPLENQRQSNARYFNGLVLERNKQYKPQLIFHTSL